MGFLFDLPLILSGPLLLAGLVGLSILGLNWFRKHQLPRLKFGHGDTLSEIRARDRGAERPGARDARILQPDDRGPPRTVGLGRARAARRHVAAGRRRPILSLVSAFYFPVTDPRLHRAQVGLLAVFIGLVIFMILALDRPYRGDLGLKATPYQVVYEQLMEH